MSIRIRKMKAGDATVLAELWHEMAMFHAKGDPYWRVKRNGRIRYAGYMRKALGAPDKIVYVAHDGEKVVGFVLAVLDARERVFAGGSRGRIQDLVVTAKWRRKGIGRKLVAKAWDWFGRKSVRTVEVRAATSNPVATAFWRKMGFEQYVAICRKKVRT